MLHVLQLYIQPYPTTGHANVTADSIPDQAFLGCGSLRCCCTSTSHTHIPSIHHALITSLAQPLRPLRHRRSVTFVEGVRLIGDEAFRGSQLTEVTLPPSRGSIRLCLLACRDDHVCAWRERGIRGRVCLQTVPRGTYLRLGPCLYAAVNSRSIQPPSLLLRGWAATVARGGVGQRNRGRARIEPPLFILVYSRGDPREPWASSLVACCENKQRRRHLELEQVRTICTLGALGVQLSTSHPGPGS